MIKLTNITKIYPNGFEAIKGVDLDVQKGDIMGIIGYSGAGKSTLIRIINRLEEPTSGQLTIENVDMLALSQKQLQKERQKIGMIFQHFNLLESRNVFGNVAFCLEIAGWKKDCIKVRVDELLELVGLSEKAAFYPSQLSGGQKQRVAIARALANNPKILLCDEATSALDSKTTHSILDLLKDLQARFNLTIVLITHQIEVVQKICNNMCVMSGGQIVERGNVESVFEKPQHAITRELLSFLPAFSSEEILRNAGKNAYKLSFKGKYIHDALISQVIKKFDIDVNILAGNIEALNKAELGFLFVQFIGSALQIQDSINYLESKGILVERI
ncbi:ATP-binding cassette domain-containing protein [Helicobacter saguini]|uniref:Cell division ATP-binding protein FtsE n=1 Tax=Helicobacter saguini TaxID=1548018 RepID=A0A347VP86_9HELI|nr:ATP-binding cassette domain-containing protein [Helicobacter saguini]MWV61469.1 ATP-binding cassette domain-containing protein [Helicobacter saguini]MWV67859.1 ATP-binding cassette domain-containing protein [Helicobacter saguini]MWV70672.1 ATP-binding cassette domain-containing protein [Helicobacter saguini]MWV72576.1 ATP-binding cassette domain-containing protein [Helicobacter saguini]TLD94691.1 ATP-binding cassette domain-containing protein [Helicobacter saguini]